MAVNDGVDDKVTSGFWTTRRLALLAGIAGGLFVLGMVVWAGGVMFGAWFAAAMLVELVGRRWSKDDSTPLHLLDVADVYRVPRYRRPPGGPGWKVQILRYGFCLALLAVMVMDGDWSNGVVLAALMLWIGWEHRRDASG